MAGERDAMCESALKLYMHKAGLSGGGGQPGLLPGAPTYKGRQDVTTIIVNMVTVNSGFLTRKNFS